MARIADMVAKRFQTVKEWDLILAHYVPLFYLTDNVIVMIEGEHLYDCKRY